MIQYTPDSTSFTKLIYGERTGCVRVFYRTGQIYTVTSNHGLRLDSLYQNWLQAPQLGTFFSVNVVKNKEDYTVTREPHLEK